MVLYSVLQLEKFLEQFVESLKALTISALRFIFLKNVVEGRKRNWWGGNIQYLNHQMLILWLL